jgi:hypothetical protein
VAVFHGVGGKMVARSGSNQAMAIVETSRQPHPTARGRLRRYSFLLYARDHSLVYLDASRHIVYILYRSINQET